MKIQLQIKNIVESGTLTDYLSLDHYSIKNAYERDPNYGEDYREIEINDDTREAILDMIEVV